MSRIRLYPINYQLSGDIASVFPLIDIDTCPGYLISVDSYMNLNLANTEEYIDGVLAGNLGEVLIRYYSHYHSIVINDFNHRSIVFD